MSLFNQFQRGSFARIMSRAARKRKRTIRRLATSAEFLEERLLLAAVYGDFNDDGHADLVTYIPRGDNGSLDYEGSVQVEYGGGLGTETFNQNDLGQIAEAGDGFGTTLAVGKINGDEFDDLVVSAPWEHIGNIANAEVFFVIYGSESGLDLSNSSVWFQGKVGAERAIAGKAESGDHFGLTLSVGDYNGDGYDDVAAGVPGEDIEGFTDEDDAGAVNIIYGGPNGLSTLRNRVFSQNTPNDLHVSAGLIGSSTDGIKGESEDDDQFGFALTTGDFDGDGIDDLAVGVPGENDDAGAVNVIYGSDKGLGTFRNRLFRQGKNGVEGAAGNGDKFGAALASGDFDGDGFSDLAIGVPFEDIENNSAAGAVNVLYGGQKGISADGNRIWYQGYSNVPGSSETNDSFGIRLVTGNFNGDVSALGIPIDDLAITARYEDIGSQFSAGAVTVIYGSQNRLQPSVQNGGVIDAELWSAGDFNYGEEQRYFGSWLASASSGFDVYDDLTIGAEDLRETLEVWKLYGSPKGLQTSPPLLAPSGQVVEPVTPFKPPTAGSFGGSQEVVEVEQPKVSFPTPPKFLQPVPNTTLLDGTQIIVTDDTPSLIWTQVIGASEYELLVYDLAGGFEVVGEDALKANFFTTQPLNEGRVYQAFVRAENAAGTFTEYSAPLEFLVKISSLNSLSNNNSNSESPANEEGSRIVATWSSLKGVNSYDLIAYDVAKGKEVANVTGIVGSSFDLTDSLAGIDEFTVYTRPRSLNGVTGNWARVESFSETAFGEIFVGVPSVPTLTGPVGEYIGVNPLISWTEAANASSYEILIYNKDSGQEFLNKTAIDSESFSIVDSMNANTNYQAFVRSENATGETSSWSTPIEFQTTASAPLPETPEFLLNQFRTIRSLEVKLSSQPSISWNSSANAASYEILLYNKKLGKLVEQAKGISETQFTPSEALDSSMEYQIFVRAWNKTGQTSSWSIPLEFGIKASSLVTVDLVFSNPQVLFAG